MPRTERGRYFCAAFHVQKGSSVQKRPRKRTSPQARAPCGQPTAAPPAARTAMRTRASAAPISIVQVEKAEDIWAALEADCVSVMSVNKLDELEICDGSKVYLLNWTNCGECYNSVLRQLFSKNVKKVSHHVKDLMCLLLKDGLSTEGFLFDTALAAYLLDATGSDYSLERVSAAHLGRELSGAEAIFALYPVLTEKLIRLLLEKRQLQGSTGTLMIREGNILFYPNGNEAPSVNRSMIYRK